MLLLLLLLLILKHLCPHVFVTDAVASVIVNVVAAPDITKVLWLGLLFFFLLLLCCCCCCCSSFCCCCCCCWRSCDPLPDYVTLTSIAIVIVFVAATGSSLTSAVVLLIFYWCFKLQLTFNF